MDNQAETIITGSRSIAAVAVSIYGKGTTIHWNMGGHILVWTFGLLMSGFTS